MSPHKVTEILGRPRSIHNWYGRGGQVVEKEWRFVDRLSVIFLLHHGRLGNVNNVRTYSPRDRLPNGLHVNSPERVVRRTVPSSVCGQYSGTTDGRWPKGQVCNWFPRQRKNLCAPYLSFYMKHTGGRVKYIELSDGLAFGC